MSNEEILNMINTLENKSTPPSSIPLNLLSQFSCVTFQILALFGGIWLTSFVIFLYTA